MSSKTKIFVLHMKEIIYTIIIAVLVLLLIGLFLFMFTTKPDKKASQTDVYTPGIYSSSITLNHTDLMVEVAVSETQIQSIRVQNLDESIATMYPLLQPTIEQLADQICSSQSLDDITLSDDTPYTSRLLLNAIEDALSQAIR